MIRYVIAVVVSISTPALAIDPAYFGVWAPSPAECRPDDRAGFRITPKGINGREWGCEIKQQSSDGGGWLVHLACATEGTEHALTQAPPSAGIISKTAMLERAAARCLLAPVQYQTTKSHDNRQGSVQN